MMNTTSQAQLIWSPGTESAFQHSPLTWFSDYTKKLSGLVRSIPCEGVEKMARVLQQSRREDRQIFVLGNGGSAANASHLATELGQGASAAVGRFRVMSLNDNVSWMTAIGNDFSYECIFEKQLENYANAGDVLIALSSSGNSANVVRNDINRCCHPATQFGARLCAKRQPQHSVPAKSLFLPNCYVWSFRHSRISGLK